jgi:preprotein translocase subunit SecA
MSDLTLAATRREARRPVAEPRRHGDPNSPLTWLRARLSAVGARQRSRSAVGAGARAAARAEKLAELSDQALLASLTAARLALRRPGASGAAAIEALAISGEAVRRALGFAPFAEQYACASALLGGAVVEMETGEGKTLAAFLAGAVYALAGRVVHVVTSNDYLASRDAQFLAPAYAALGLTIGAVVNGDPPEKRREAYTRDLVYLSSKEVVFDSLRDGLTRPFPAFDAHLSAKISRAIGGNSRLDARPLQRGLDVAIVDEADSVLIDEAATPLVISTMGPGEISDQDARTALELSAAFERDVDFTLNAFEYLPSLTERGHLRLETLSKKLSGPWRVRLVREEMMSAAISARHILRRDTHYLVRDGKIVLIDQQSGRATPDRHWGHELSLMVEIKEGCASTGTKRSLASISYQRFFRSYATLCGMSGTVREVAREMRAVYSLDAARIPRRLPLRRGVGRSRVYSSRQELWDSVSRAAARLQALGQPALVAVRSVKEAERASAALSARGVVHRVLSAAQDGAEADIVAHAGERGQITVVTNMAGRGTDIKLGPGVVELGGLAVLICERHDSRRVDRQLVGRCARQGDPGLVIEFATPEDEVLTALPARWRSALAWFPGLTLSAVARAQRIRDARGLDARVGLLRRDEQLAKTMAFAGGLD